MRTVGGGVMPPPTLVSAAPRARSRTAARRTTSRRLRLQRAVAAVLLVVGVSVMLYPAASSWIMQAQQSAIIDRYTATVGEVPPGELETALRAARDYNDRLTGGALVGANRNLPDAESPDLVGGYHDLLDANGTGLMGRLKIPRIHLDQPVYHGTSDAVLRQGIGHLQGTALPVGGAGTHSVLTGHRGLADAELFTHLDQVQVGDTFTVEVFGEVLTYRVRSTDVVEPEDTESLFPVAGDDLITLVTCTPLGINTQRILVTGERVTPTPIRDIEAGGASPDVPGFPWWIPALVAAIVLGVTYALVPARRRRPHRDGVPAGTPERVVRVSDSNGARTR